MIFLKTSQKKDFLYKVSPTAQSRYDPRKRLNLAPSVLDKSLAFMKTIYFSDEVTYSLNGKANKQNVRIFGSERPDSRHQIYASDSSKVNVFFA